MEIKAKLKDNLFAYWLYNRLRYDLPSYILGERWDIIETERKFKNVFGRELNWNNPETLNEKMQWLKLNVRENFHTVYADKLAARKIWRQYGSDGLIPLLYQTDDWRDITNSRIPDVPCIIKANTGSGTYQIIRDKGRVSIQRLRHECRKWMMVNYYHHSQEWQYKNIKPCIIIEQLLLDKNGHIPNDYKLHFINGELRFVYCSIDREGANYRSIYSPEWKRMNMEWVGVRNHKGGLFGDDIPKPETFKRMREIGTDIAKRFKYVRVDFYEVDGRLYYGEITLHHGSGFDTFEPPYWDKYYGEMLALE